MSRTLIAQTALRLADEEGLAALTIRGVARRLGVEPMSIYNHFANKNAMLDGVWDEILASAVLAPDHPDPTWQGYLRQTAAGYRRALLAHPGVLPTMLDRTARTAQSLDLVQKVIAGLTTRGVPLLLAADMVNIVSLLTIAHVITEHRSMSVTEPPPIDPDRHAVLLEVITQSASLDPVADDERRFRAAVDALIHGYGAAVEADGTAANRTLGRTGDGAEERPSR